MNHKLEVGKDMKLLQQGIDAIHPTFKNSIKQYGITDIKC